MTLYMESYDYAETRPSLCQRCGRLTLHDIYDGHTFAEGMTLSHCKTCGMTELI